MKAGDFAALSGVTNLLSTLEKARCEPMEDFRKRSFVFDSPDKLGEPSKPVTVASRCFMMEFWASFGLDHARKLVEARRA